MHIKFISERDRAARLANVRLVLVKDLSCRAPDENSDLIFHRGHGEVWGFKLRETYGYETEVFTASKEKVEEESKACGHKNKAEMHKWLDGIKEAEKKMWQAWMDGEVYGIAIQKWDDTERQFRCIDCSYELYGWNDVVEALKDMDLSKVKVFCVDEDCGNPNNWKKEFRELDV